MLTKACLGLFPEIHRSPLGVVEKAGGSDIRVINKYSYPPGGSVNELTDRTNFPAITYNPPKGIARRIQLLQSQFPSEKVAMMLGDVSGAFHHIRTTPTTRTCSLSS